MKRPWYYREWWLNSWAANPYKPSEIRQMKGRKAVFSEGFYDILAEDWEKSLEKAYQAARAEALKEAAKVCEDMANERRAQQKGYARLGWTKKAAKMQGEMDKLKEAAGRILALKEKRSEEEL